MNTSTPAKSITRRVTILDRIDGAVIQVRVHTVTLSRDTLGGPISATVDGVSAELAEGVSLLNQAESLEVLERVEFAAPLGKPRAHKLHRIMARLGLAHAEHYRFAARALGQKVESLAALSEQEARRVWAALVSAYPQAKTVAA